MTPTTTKLFRAVVEIAPSNASAVIRLYDLRRRFVCEGRAECKNFMDLIEICRLHARAEAISRGGVLAELALACGCRLCRCPDAVSCRCNGNKPCADHEAIMAQEAVRLFDQLRRATRVFAAGETPR